MLGCKLFETADDLLGDQHAGNALAHVLAEHAVEPSLQRGDPRWAVGAELVDFRLAGSLHRHLGADQRFGIDAGQVGDRVLRKSVLESELAEFREFRLGPVKFEFNPLGKLEILRQLDLVIVNLLRQRVAPDLLGGVARGELGKMLAEIIPLRTGCGVEECLGQPVRPRRRSRGRSRRRGRLW